MSDWRWTRFGHVRIENTGVYSSNCGTWAKCFETFQGMITKHKISGGITVNELQLIGLLGSLQTGLESSVEDCAEASHKMEDKSNRVTTRGQYGNLERSGKAGKLKW